MNAEEFAQQAYDQKGPFKQVFWVACGGSVIDLYPACCFLNATSPSIESSIYTAAEFCTLPPARLGKDTLVVTCSHSGGTVETIAATQLAQDRGAAIVTMTNNAGSEIDSKGWPCWVYEWEDETPQAERPAGFSLRLSAELIRMQDGYDKGDILRQGLTDLDGIIAGATPRVIEDLGTQFVDQCRNHDFFYILGSGPTFCQTYGMAICSMMEMQWQNCSYINSAEYFHGPFECTEDGVFYFLQKSAGATRPIDERAERFLKTHTNNLLVLDSAAYGMGQIDETIRTYLDPIFFYDMNVVLRGVRGKAFDHDPDIRRYMGVVKY